MRTAYISLLKDKNIKQKKDFEQCFLEMFEIYKEQQQGVCQMQKTIKKIKMHLEDNQVTQLIYRNFNQMLLVHQHMNSQNNLKLSIIIERLSLDDLFKPIVLIKTLDFINKVLEYNFDVESKLQSMGVQGSQLNKIKAYNQQIKDYVRKTILPGQKINTDKILSTFQKKGIIHFSSIIEDCIQIQAMISQFSEAHPLEYKIKSYTSQGQMNDEIERKIKVPKFKMREKNNKFEKSLKIEINFPDYQYIESRQNTCRPMSAQQLFRKTSSQEPKEIQNSHSIAIKTQQPQPQIVKIRKLAFHTIKDTHQSGEVRFSSRKSSQAFVPKKKEQSAREKDLYTQLMKQNQPIKEKYQNFYKEYKQWASIKFGQDLATFNFYLVDQAWMKFIQNNDIRLKRMLHQKDQI